MIQLSDIILKANEAISIKYNNLIYELKQKGHNPTVLSLGEAFFDMPLMDMSVLPIPAAYHYTHTRGIIELRRKIASYYEKMYGVPVDPDREIVVVSGSKAAIHFALMTLLNPGDEVIIPEPAWVSYVEMVKLCYGKPVMVPYTKSYKDYEKYITPKTKALFLNNPHNPTGYIYSQDEVRYIMDMARKNNIYVIGDEAYSDFTNNSGEFNSIGKFDQKFSNAIVCNSISKNFGISGWRIGYVISNPDLITNLLKVSQHLVTCAPSILQHYMHHYFEHIIKITYPQIKEVVKKRNELGVFMNSIGLKALPGTGTFYFFVSIEPSKLSSIEFCNKLLDEYMVCVVPGIGYGDSCDKFVRVSVGTETTERIHDGLRKLKEVIDKTS